MRRARLVLIALVAAAAGASCFGPTQVRVALRTDLPCNGLTTAVYVGPAGARPDAARAETIGCAHASGDDNLGTIVLSPSGARDAKVLVEVITATAGKRPEACRDAPEGCVVARRLVSYRRGETRDLPVRLTSSCVGVRCDDLAETCVAGLCLPADVEDARFCDGVSCTPDAAAPDAGAPDADAGDAAPDAPIVDPNAPCAAGERVLTTGVRVLGTAPMRAGTTHVYWFGGVGAYAAPKAGGAPNTVPTGTTMMSPTPQALFTTDGTNVLRMSLDGLVPAWSAIAPDTIGLAGADDRVYVLQSNAIQRYGPNAQVELSFVANGARFVATTAEDVVWLTPAQIVTRRIVDAETRFYGLPAGFQTPADLVTTPSGWIAALGVGRTIQLLAPPAGSGGRVATTFAEPDAIVGIALDDAALYATTTTGAEWTLARFSLATGARTVVTSGPEILSPPASDGTCLYFARGNPQSADLIAHPRL